MKRNGIAAGVIAALLLLIMGAGATYEFVTRNRLARQFPPSGKMIDIGGRRIQLDCRGTGFPVVVLESGMDLNGSLSWARVHDDLAKVSSTCAYSRAGMLWSDPAPGKRNGTAVAEDLHAALIAAGEQSPLVLVGHSLGGPYTMIYTKHYGAEVAGLVLVDPSHSDQIARYSEIEGRDRTQLDWLTQIEGLLGKMGTDLFPHRSRTHLRGK